jgi:serine phosphatase RsbU (regulator of sigma subunit)
MGLFAVGYAAAGVILRGKILKALLPLLILQFLCMGLLGHFFPDRPQGAASKTADSSSRLQFDGWAIVASIVLGYTGFITSSVSEARRHIKIQTEKARLESEMTAAREVQRVMVPEKLPTIPGYAIESIYSPAAEVGGDFYQLIPLKSGSSLAVIGDVSGKGLSAAMIVSMIVGLLGAVSALTEEPGEILAELNRRLHGRMHGGFATCLVVRLDPAGRLIFAIAGHLAPYLNGREIAFPGSLPIGLIETESFGQTSIDLQDGDLVVLLTDGIPEAQNGQGHLFGFPRVESMLQEGASPRDLAEAAQQYGQTDDITVISIARNA